MNNFLVVFLWMTFSLKQSPVLMYWFPSNYKFFDSYFLSNAIFCCLYFNKYKDLDKVDTF